MEYTFQKLCSKVREFLTKSYKYFSVSEITRKCAFWLAWKPVMPNATIKLATFVFFKEKPITFELFFLILIHLICATSYADVSH